MQKGEKTKVMAEALVQHLVQFQRQAKGPSHSMPQGQTVTSALEAACAAFSTACGLPKSQNSLVWLPKAHGSRHLAHREKISNHRESRNGVNGILRGDGRRYS